MLENIKIGDCMNGMNGMKKFEDMECEELKDYCLWEGEPVACYGGLPVMCEAGFCKEAYENYVEDYLDNLHYENIKMEG